MFEFDEVEEKRIKQLEKQIFELDNQVKHWKSMYQMEVKKRPVVVKYENDNESSKRLKKILKLHHDTKDKRLQQTLIETLYLDYGIEKQPTDAVYDFWVRGQNE